MRPVRPPAGRAARIGARACLGVAAVAGVFTLIVFLLLIASHAQSRRADPLESPSLKALREDLRRQPQRPGLVEEYRRLDLLARRAYFDAAAFRRTGAWLLLGGSLVLLASLRCRALLAPAPRRVPAGTAGAAAARQDAAATARWLAATAGLAAAVTLGLLALRFPPPPGDATWPAGGGPAWPPVAPRDEAAVPRQSSAGESAVTSPGAAAKGSGTPAAGIAASQPAPAGGAAVPAADVEGAVLWARRLQEWPAFRGPDGGARAGGDGYPTDWDGATGRNVLWRAALPLPGFNSPVVWGDRVFATGADATARAIFCLDARDGRLLWRHEVEGVPGSPATPPAVTPDTGHAASTVATDGRRVFAIFANGDLVAVDFAGRRLWGVNLGVPDNPYGHASSPLVWRDRLIVQYDHRLQARVLALDAATGGIAWERFRESNVTWSSPILVEREGREELVLNGNPAVAGYDPATGDELWSIPVLTGEVAVSPAHDGGMLFAANEYARLAAIALAGGPRILWEHGEDLPEVSSPLAARGLLFIANGAGVLTCLDARAGKVLWRREFDTGFYASPVLAGGLVHLVDRSGVMRIFEPAAEYRERASPALGKGTTVTPAFAAGRIYFRAEREVVCVGAAGAGGAAR
jgi:outer membrane protein assembly factor BamB